MTDWFDYEWIDVPDEGPRLFPMLAVRLEVATRTLATYGLVDSGAEESYVPRWVAEKLRCMPAHFHGTAHSAGGPFPVGGAWLQAKVLLAQGQRALPLCEFNIPGPGFDVPHVVLGRVALFHAFEVRFKEYRRQFGLGPRPTRWMGLQARAVRGRSGGAPGPASSGHRSR